MPEMMKAALVHEFGKSIVIEDVPVPEVPDGQVLVKVVTSGVCHTDLHAACGDWAVKPTLPFIPGHEGVGFVAPVGRGVKLAKEGDRVGMPWLHTACGDREHCIIGWEALCDAQQMTCYSANGGYAEYVLAGPGYIGHLPEALGFEAAAPVLCAGVTVNNVFAHLARQRGGENVSFGGADAIRPITFGGEDVLLEPSSVAAWQALGEALADAAARTVRIYRACCDEVLQTVLASRDASAPLRLISFPTLRFAGRAFDEETEG